MRHVTKYCNVIVPHCTVRRDTACIRSSPYPSLLLRKWVGLARLDYECGKKEREDFIVLIGSDWVCLCAKSHHTNGFKSESKMQTEA